MKSIISKSILLTMAVIIVNFGFKIFLSYHIAKADIGLFYTLIDMISVASLVFSGYKDSMIKVVADNQFFYLKFYIFRDYTILTIILLIVLFYFFDTSSTRLFEFDWLLAFFIISQISNYYSYLNVAYRNYNSMLFEKSIKALALTFSFIFYIQFLDTLLALIISYITQLVLHIIYLYITSPKIFFINNHFHNNKKLYKGFFKNYILSTTTSFFGSISIYLSGVIMLHLYSNSGMLAEYQIVAKSIFFALVAVFVHPVTAYTFPELSKFISQSKYNEVKRIDKKLKQYLFFFMILLLLSMPFSSWVIGIVFPLEYKNSYLMLNSMLPMLPFIVYTSFSINIIKSFNRFDLALYIRIIGTILFFLSIYMFYFIGIDAMSIPYSLDISFLAMFALAFYYKRRLLI